VNRRWLALAADVGCVLVFVVLGRRSHDEGDSVASTLNVAAPFLIGLAIGWLASPHLHHRPSSIRAGLDVWVATVVIGVLLRWFAWDRSTAFTFVLVAAAFLGLFLLGWRVVATATSPPRRAVRSQRPPLEADR
jgi:hypothetical protein